MESLAARPSRPSPQLERRWSGNRYAGATASWTAVGEGLEAHTAFRFGSVLVAGTSLQSQDTSGKRAVSGKSPQMNCHEEARRGTKTGFRDPPFV